MQAMDTHVVIAALRYLRAPRLPGDDRIVVLIKAAKAGHIAALECAMPICLCPDGRDHFERRGTSRRAPWAPSADRWPVPGRDGGLYRADNVRLSHWRCNAFEARGIGGRAGRGVRHVLSPEGRAVLVKSGQTAMARGIVLTPEGRAAQVRNGRRLGSLPCTPEGRERARQLGRLHGPTNFRAAVLANTERAATPEGRAELLRRLALGRPTKEQLVANARRVNCTRWALGRGKPCNCGTHL